MANRAKTLLLLTLLTGLLLFIGEALGGRSGLVMALFFAFIMNFISYWFSDSIVLKMYGAREVTPAEMPELHGIIDELVQSAGLPKPKVCVVPEQAPNAFATGRNPEHSAVAVTEGILRVLSPQELKGVIAHELSHIKHRDTLISTVAATIAGAIMFLLRMAQWAWMFGGSRDDDNGGGNILASLLLIVVGPLAAMIIQMAISRSREFMADEEGARISHAPMALADALLKLEAYAHRVPMERATPTTSSFFIVNPLTGKGLLRLFSTHPSTEERVERLRQMARS
ncbi:MAG TPA: zinc metalloprotease HtpX [Candidatus Aminicenantes bacterium]|nr:zinc metalloprotease HtpX [Candidatus Aminicenantes bacterium]HPB54453.1 zinc metalloprotease HtpX [Candidatus Aminicenantes bacterium]HPT00422.1 zinc metalloprotease HtpX [Candidatus Aminicenantes bacterium]